MSYTRDDFLNALTAEVSNYPEAAQFYQAGDPRLLAQLGAMATMLAMLSQQIDVESMEPFIKSRDTTVLADASMKGILPFARPSRVSLTVQNTYTSDLVINVGRRFLDQSGHVYVAEQGVTIAQAQSGTVPVKQLTTRTYSHTVSGSTPFYPVQIPVSSDPDLIISGVLVSVAGTSYPYTPEFSNLAANAPGFTLETDEYRRLYAKFGWANTFGIQPANGTVIDFTIEETAGLLTLSAGAPFTFETSTGTADDLAKITLASVTFPGANPVDIQTLREWSNYPSTYDSNAVYLGNFDFLIRQNLSSLRFLSVWNEQLEEKVRGANLQNINRLFVSALMDGTDTTWLQSQITNIVAGADNSYYLKFLTPVETPLSVTIAAQVSVVHDLATVQNQIKQAVLALYGRDSAASKKGMLTLNYRLIYDTLKANVPALQDSSSDFQITLPAPPALLPEQYRYVSDTSLTVNVTQATYNDGLWSH